MLRFNEFVVSYRENKQIKRTKHKPGVDFKGSPSPHCRFFRGKRTSKGAVLILEREMTGKKGLTSKNKQTTRSEKHTKIEKHHYLPFLIANLCGTEVFSSREIEWPSPNRHFPPILSCLDPT